MLLTRAAKIKPTPIAQPVKGINRIPREIAFAAFTNNIYTLANKERQYKQRIPAYNWK